MDQSPSHTPEPPHSPEPPSQSPHSPSQPEHKTHTDGLPCVLVEQLGFKSREIDFKKISSVTLAEIIKQTTQTQTMSAVNTHRYTIKYASVSFNYERDDQPAKCNTLEANDTEINYYTFSPAGLFNFINCNKHNKYTFLPITAANQYVMLLIFDNTNKTFYWFDCGIHNCIPESKVENILDIMFLNLAGLIKLTRYSYEPSLSWQINDLFRSSGIKSLDRVISIGWCYNIMTFLPHYDSLVGYLSVLDCLTDCDRFNLCYRGLVHLSKTLTL